MRQSFRMRTTGAGTVSAWQTATAEILILPQIPQEPEVGCSR
jgi:hypothetical protein